jgi:hypothetical protein
VWVLPARTGTTLLCWRWDGWLLVLAVVLLWAEGSVQVLGDWRQGKSCAAARGWEIDGAGCMHELWFSCTLTTGLGIAPLVQHLLTGHSSYFLLHPLLPRLLPLRCRRCASSTTPTCCPCTAPLCTRSTCGW